MMNVNVSPILQQSNSERKRKNQPVSYIKKFRSKIPRRKRVQISPIINESSNSLFSDKQKTEFSAFTTASSSSSCFPGEISCNSSWISVGSENLNRKQRSYSKKQRIEKIRGCRVGIRPNARSYCKPEKNSDGEFRRITRAYSKQKEIERTVEKKGNGDCGVEVSEYSCLESTSGVDAEVVHKSDEFSKRNAKQLKTRSYKGTTKATESDENVTSAVIKISGISCIQPSPQEKVKNLSKLIKFNGTSKEAEMSLENEGYEVILETSCLESLSESKNKILCPSDCISSEKTTKDDEIRASVTEFPENSRNQVELNLSVSNLESTGEQKTEDFELDSVLGCSEKLSYEDDSDYSTTQEMTFSQLESEILGQRSDLDFSDYSPLLCLESASDFSERSTGKSAPSVCFLLLLQYRNQFIESCSRPEIGVSSRIQDEYFDDFTLLRFEDEETEESYKMLRTRERSQMLLHNYIEEYYSTTEYGELDVEQRLLMVNWIIEQSDAKEFHYETMFLGVSLFDRFLSRGFFKSKRNLQLVGIACLTLATRIEEKQPNNSIQQMTFHVGRNVYSRSEVVAMEWLVQEVLNFQCCFPTIYNFLWFYLKAAKADAEVENRAKYLVVLSLLDHELLCYWPSTIAAGLVILSSLASNQDPSCQWVMETHVRTKNDDLPECIQSLEWLVKYVC